MVIKMWLCYLIRHLTFHQENMSMKNIPPLTPVLCSKNGVCRGILNFLTFDPNHTLWVLVRTASPTINVLCKNVKNIEIFQFSQSVYYIDILNIMLFITDFRSPWSALADSKEQYSLRWESKYLFTLGAAFDYLLQTGVSMATTEALKYTVLSGNILIYLHFYCNRPK